MAGMVVLSGGNEFEPESRALNVALLRAAKAKKPHVVIVPVASTDNPRKAARGGIGTFSALGARVEAPMIADAATANDVAMSAPMETADVIYLTDGNPMDAVSALAGTQAFAKLKHYWEAGTLLAASGGAGMALCATYWDSGEWENGLGLLKWIAVLPHHQFVVGRFSPARLQEKLPAGLTLIGLDDSTGVIIRGQQATVYGPVTVTVYRAEDTQDYVEGDMFTLPNAMA